MNTGWSFLVMLILQLLLFEEESWGVLTLSKLEMVNSSSFLFISSYSPATQITTGFKKYETTVQTKVTAFSPPASASPCPVNVSLQQSISSEVQTSLSSLQVTHPFFLHQFSPFHESLWATGNHFLCLAAEGSGLPITQATSAEEPEHHRMTGQCSGQKPEDWLQCLAHQLKHSNRGTNSNLS